MRGWMIPAAAVVLVEYVVALIIGATVGFHYSLPFQSYAILGLTAAAGGAVLALLVRLAVLAKQREAKPTMRLIGEAHRIVPYVVGVILVALQMAVLSWTKVMLPLSVPFWADPLLADIDGAIFGTDPWRLTHALLGSAPWLDAVYVTWAPIKFWMLALLLVMPESQPKAQALKAYFFTFCIGILGQYAFSSAGPVFYESFGFGDRFSTIPVMPWVNEAASYLWADYQASGGHVGAGISAMPSMHVALALWMALVFRSYFPRLAPVGWCYFGLILVGSVHLGWHYAVDGIAAIAIALFAWKLASWTAGRAVPAQTEVREQQVPV